MVSYCRCIYASAVLHSLSQCKLSGSWYTVTCLLPVYQIFAVEYRNPRKILKWTVHKIEIITHSAYTWVRIKPWNYRIYILHIFFLTSFKIYSRHFLKTKNSESTLSFYIYLQIKQLWHTPANTYNPIDGALCVKRILVILSAACS